MRVVHGLLVAGLLGSGVAAAGDWPGWYGPERDGVAEEAGFAKSWKKGPQVLWRAPLGAGYASVAVSEGTVYALANSGETTQLVALDAGTGAERWRATVGPAWNDGMGYHGPRATPEVADGAVVVLTGRGTLAAFDVASGAARWSVDLVATHGATAPKWGFSGTPLLSQGTVYLSAGGSLGVAAFSLADGSLRWHRAAGASGYSSPIRATIDEADTLVFFTGDGVDGTDPATGARRWFHPWDTDYDVNAATPLVLGGNRLFVASGYGVGGAALHVSDGQVLELWRTKRMKNKTATAVQLDKTIYGFNENRLASVDASTGEEGWNELGYGRGALVAVDDHLLVVHEDCRISLLAAGRDAPKPVGEPLKVLSASPCWTAPAVSNGVAYVRDGAELVALEVKRYGPSIE